MKEPVVFAIGAHPDDIEFMMAGTLLRLKAAGYALHVMNVANGHCGSATDPREKVIAQRREESQAAADAMGACLHPAIVDDLEVLYALEPLRKLGALVREVQPDILLLQSPEDYMEDHMNTCRLAVTAAFSRGMRNFVTDPPSEPVGNEVVVYHALPWGLRDALRRRIHPGHYVDIGPVLAQKRAALACHRSQKEWLDHSQGLDSYLLTMESMSREVGEWSRRFEYAEGWRLHSHLGFCGEAADPLQEALGESCWRCPDYAAGLDRLPGVKN